MRFIENSYMLESNDTFHKCASNQIIAGHALCTTVTRFVRELQFVEMIAYIWWDFTFTS